MVINTLGFLSYTETSLYLEQLVYHVLLYHLQFLWCHASAYLLPSQMLYSGKVMLQMFSVFRNPITSVPSYSYVYFIKASLCGHEWVEVIPLGFLQIYG